MDLKKFEHLRSRLEGPSFENNWTAINKVLYYFSFLGNIFLILFSYFFLKTVTNAVPDLFPGQDIFFSIFIVLFMTGYELFKRFAIEQFFQNLFLKKRGLYMLVGALVCASLITGSFYLSIKGSHRLIDDTKALTVQSDSLASAELAELKAKYDVDYKAVQTQIDNTVALVNKTVDAGTLQNRTLTKGEQRNITKWDEQVNKLKIEKSNIDSTYQASKLAIEQRDYISEVDEAIGDENNFAFYLLTIFLEILIIIGVGFNGFYNVTSFSQMKAMMSSGKYARLQSNLALLRVYYNNGAKVEGDPCPPDSKFHTLAQLQGYNLSQEELTNFTLMLEQLDIVEMRSETNYGLAIPSAKVYAMSYPQAQQVMHLVVSTATTPSVKQDSNDDQETPPPAEQTPPQPAKQITTPLWS